MQTICFTNSSRSSPSSLWRTLRLLRLYLRLLVSGHCFFFGSCFSATAYLHHYKAQGMADPIASAFFLLSFLFTTFIPLSFLISLTSSIQALPKP